MPAGLDNPAIGYAAFCAIKFAGYSLAVRVLIKPQFPLTESSSWTLGLIRTLIGMATGAAYYGISLLLPRFENSYALGYLCVLPFVRAVEWWAMLLLFFKPRPEIGREKLWRVVFFSVLWSYLLDIPATIGLLVTGGFAVC